MLDDKKVIIKMLPAGGGDCLLISFIEENYTILVDGGYSNTYHKYLKKMLIEMAERGECINLLVISHIDGDHIGGILAFLKENGTSNNPNIIAVNEVWYNAFHHMNYREINKRPITYLEQEVLNGLIASHNVDSVNGKSDISVSQGNTVAKLLNDGKYRWNTMWNGKAVCLYNGKTRNLTEKIKLILLNPGKNEMINLSSYWVDKMKRKIRKFEICESKIYDEAFENDIQNDRRLPDTEKKEISFHNNNIGKKNWEMFTNIWSDEIDDSKTNRSSIAFLLEYEGIKLLFPGDCPIQLFQENLPKEIDIVKLPHHGSEKNINKQFIRDKKVQYYLLSTDGKRHGHPSDAVIANIVCKALGSPTLIKNHEIKELQEVGEFMRYRDE